MRSRVTDAVQNLRTATEALLASRILTRSDDHISSIEHALSIEAAAHVVVDAVVKQARAEGATWQDVGRALGVTRQSAFQRYGRPTGPRTGEPMNTTPLTGVAELAVAVIEDLAAGRWSRVTEQFDPTMRDGLSDEALAVAWAQIVGLSGTYEGHGEPVAVRAADLTITNTRILLEAGDYTARITFRDERTIAGLHILEGEKS